jgi:hypothetical protein
MGTTTETQFAGYTQDDLDEAVRRAIEDQRGAALAAMSLVSMVAFFAGLLIASF